MNDNRMLKLCELWQRRSEKTSKTYFRGFWGNLEILMFRQGEKPHLTKPSETVIVWSLLAQEKDPSRRPKQPMRGQQAQDTARAALADATPDPVAMSLQQRQRYAERLASQFEDDDVDTL